MLALIACFAMPKDPPLVLEGEDVKLLAYRQNGVWVEQLFANDAKGVMRMVLASPGSVALPVQVVPGAVQGFQKGLYQGIPDFGFTDVKVSKSSTEQVAAFTVKTAGGTFTKHVHIPAK